MRGWFRLAATDGLSLGLALFAVVGGGAAAAPPAGDVRVITVEGAGKDVETAKRDAYREAVRQVVGGYVDSETLVKNDSLIEDRIITLSSGFVEKSEPLSERMEDGITRVRLRAHVRVTPILRALQSQNVATAMVDGESLQAQLTTKGDQAEGLEQIFAAVLPTLHERSLRVTVPGKPAVRAVRGDQAKIAFRVAIGPNLEGYLAAAAKLDAALSVAERPSGEIVSSGNTPNDGRTFQERVRSWKTRSEMKTLIKGFFGSGYGERLDELWEHSGDCPIVDYGPFYLICDPSAASHLPYGVFDLTRGPWRRATRTNGTVVICLCIHSNESFVQTRWKWYALTADEAVAFYEHAPGGITCSARLATLDGTEVAHDRVSLWGTGAIKLNENQCHAITIAPFFMDFYSLRAYFPTLSFEREVTLTKDEAARVGQIRATVTAGPRMRRPAD